MRKLSIERKDKKLLARLFGFLLSDGSIIIDERKRIGKIKFTAKDRKLLEEFNKTVKKLFKINPKVSLKGSATDAWFHSIKLAEELWRVTKGMSSIPQFIFNGSMEIKKEFLRTFISCDGGITVTVHRWGIEGRIVIGEGKESIRKQLMKILNEFGIITKDDGYNHLRSVGRKSLTNFYEKIGFMDGVYPVRSKQFGHLSKNEILLMVLSSHRPKGIRG